MLTKFAKKLDISLSSCLSYMPEIDNPCILFRKSDYVAKKLQKDDMNWSNVHVSFDAIFLDHEEFERYFNHSASTGHLADFESDIARIIYNQEN